MAEASMSEREWLDPENEEPLFEGRSADRDCRTVRRAALKVMRRLYFSLHDVDDLTQETTLNIKKHGMFDTSKRVCLLRFATQVAHRIALRWIERAQRLPITLSDVDLDSILRHTIGGEAYIAMLVRDIELYFSETERDTLYSSVVGETDSEMADRVGIVDSAARARRFRMRRRAEEVLRNGD